MSRGGIFEHSESGYKMEIGKKENCQLVVKTLSINMLKHMSNTFDLSSNNL